MTNTLRNDLSKNQKNINTLVKVLLIANDVWYRSLCGESETTTIEAIISFIFTKTKSLSGKYASILVVVGIGQI